MARCVRGTVRAHLHRAPRGGRRACRSDAQAARSPASRRPDGRRRRRRQPRPASRPPRRETFAFTCQCSASWAATAAVSRAKARPGLIGVFGFDAAEGRHRGPDHDGVHASDHREERDETDEHHPSRHLPRRPSVAADRIACRHVAFSGSAEMVDRARPLPGLRIGDDGMSAGPKPRAAATNTCSPGHATRGSDRDRPRSTAIGPLVTVSPTILRSISARPSTVSTKLRRSSDLFRMRTVKPLRSSPSDSRTNMGLRSWMTLMPSLWRVAKA